MKLVNKLTAMVILPIALLLGTSSHATEISYPNEPESTQEFFDQVFDEKEIELSMALAYNSDDLICLAKNIYYEARGESIQGKRAVAQVTLNRVKNPKFRNTICGVVYEPNQFSWANDKSKRWSVPSGKAWAEAQHLAEEILSNGKAISGMDNALFFHSRKINPGWRNMRRLASIGGHVFYGRG